MEWPLKSFCFVKTCPFYSFEMINSSAPRFYISRKILPEGILLWTLVQWFVRVPCLQNLRPIGELVDKMRLEFWALAFFGAATAPPHFGSSKWDLLKTTSLLYNLILKFYSQIAAKLYNYRMWSAMAKPKLSPIDESYESLLWNSPIPITYLD